MTNEDQDHEMEGHPDAPANRGRKIPRNREQNPQSSLMDDIRLARRLMFEGRFNRQEFDHAHPSKNGGSTKRIEMLAHRMLEPGTFSSYDEAWDIFAELVTGQPIPEQRRLLHAFQRNENDRFMREAVPYDA